MVERDTVNIVIDVRFILETRGISIMVMLMTFNHKDVSSNLIYPILSYPIKSIKKSE